MPIIDSMDLNFTIKDIYADKLDKIKLPCANCTYWLDASRLSLFDDINLNTSIWQLFKSKFFELKNLANKKKFLNFIIENGGIVKAAFSNKKCVGMLVAGKYYYFQKLKFFKFYPPDPESIFLTCLYVLPEYRNLGIGKKLLIALEKDLIKNRIRSIEAVCKRLDDDTVIEDYINSPIIPVKFLIKNGFYIKQNDVKYPLLRLDMSSLAKSREFLNLKFLFRKVEVERPAKIPIKKSD